MDVVGYIISGMACSTSNRIKLPPGFIRLILNEYVQNKNA